MSLHSQESGAPAPAAQAVGAPAPAAPPAPPGAAGGRHAAPPAAGRRWWSLLVVCLGVMMAFINVTSTISALTAIQDDLHPDPSTLVWITSAYSLVVVSLVMSAGTLADLVGRRRVFIGGAAVFAAASALAFAAPGAGLLIAAQALMGVGGAAVLPSSLSIVSHGFTDPGERTTAISVWAAFSGIGLAAGPLLSGLLLGTIVIAAATYAIIEGASAGYTAGQIVAMYIVSAVALALFIRVETRHA